MAISEAEYSRLANLARSSGYDRSVASRAQIVLWWEEGFPAAEIADMAGTTKPTVYKWVRRYRDSGLAGLESVASPGGPRRIPGSVRGRILALTRQAPPDKLGLSHWTSREMARYLDREEGIRVSHDFVATVWRENGLKPGRSGTFKLSTDPDFEAKVFDVVGLYLNPPEGAVVLSCDEKTQVQALDRTQPVLPIDFGKGEKRTHDYIRHGTTNLFAALNVQTGQVTAQCFERRRTVEFIGFMDRVVSEYEDDREVHVIVDNLSTHSGNEIDKWLTRHTNVRLHYTPTGSSWLNQVEMWFGVITRQAIRRGTFKSLVHLIRRIEDYLRNWNQDPKPFEWVASPAEIVAKVRILHRDFRKLLANNAK
jgi:transposase